MTRNCLYRPFKGRTAQDFHTAPEVCQAQFKSNSVLQPQRPYGLLWDGESRTATSTFTQLLSSERRGYNYGLPQAHGYHLELNSSERICSAAPQTEQLDWRAKQPSQSDLLLGRSKVLRSLRHCQRAQSQGHHTINHLEERSARPSSLIGRERAIVQTKTGTGSKATLGKLLTDAYHGFSERINTILN